METLDFAVVFESGAEESRCLDRETFERTEYWAEVTNCQNRYDLSDVPETVVIGGKRIPVDDDGLWMSAFDAVAKELWPDAVAFS